MRTNVSVSPLRMVLLALAAMISAAALMTGPAAWASPAAAGAPAAHRLTPVQCAALRVHLHRPALDCAGIVVTAVAPGHTVTLRAARPADPGTTAAQAAVNAASTYKHGVLLACSERDPSCPNAAWAVYDDFSVTYINNVGVWDNTHSCTRYATPVTWCGTWHNGYSNYMEEGFNFGNNGYARLEIDTYGNTTVGAHNSYAYVYGCLNPCIL